MKGPIAAVTRRTILLSLGTLAAIAAIFILPSGRTKAVGDQEKGLYTRTVSQVDDLPNYDIRTDKTAAEKIASFRSTLNKQRLRHRGCTRFILQGRKSAKGTRTQPEGRI